MSTHMSNDLFVKKNCCLKADGFPDKKGMVVRIKDDDFNTILTIFFDSWGEADAFAQQLSQAVDSVQPEEDEPETPEHPVETGDPVGVGG